MLLSNFVLELSTHPPTATVSTLSTHNIYTIYNIHTIYTQYLHYLHTISTLSTSQSGAGEAPVTLVAGPQPRPRQPAVAAHVGEGAQLEILNSVDIFCCSDNCYKDVVLT